MSPQPRYEMSTSAGVISGVLLIVAVAAWGITGEWRWPVLALLAVFTLIAIDAAQRAEGARRGPLGPLAAAALWGGFAAPLLGAPWRWTVIGLVVSILLAILADRRGRR